MLLKEIESAKLLCEKCAAEANDRYKDSEAETEVYHVTVKERDTKGFIVQSTYNNTFYSFGHYVSICEACGCDSYVTIEENEKGVKTPTLVIV